MVMSDKISKDDPAVKQLEEAIKLYYQEGDSDVLVTRTWNAFSYALFGVVRDQKVAAVNRLMAIFQAREWPTSSKAFRLLESFCVQMEGGMTQIDTMAIVVALSFSCYMSNVEGTAEHVLIAGFIQWDNMLGAGSVQ